MKNFYKKVMIIVTVALIAGYNVYKSQSIDGMSELMLMNVEALATPEIDIPYICVGDIPACYDDYYNIILDGFKQR